MQLKYLLNWNKRFVKTVNTKNKLNCMDGRTDVAYDNNSRVGVKYSTSTWYLYLVHIYQYLLYLSTWCMEMSKYLYLTKKNLVLTSNFQVLFIKKCKNS